MRNINKQQALTSPLLSGGRTAESNKSNFKLGSFSTLNRIDTSSGSAFTPKTSVEHHNTKDLTEAMRKTNFVLSFKRDDKLFPSITRNIAIISEEDEPPASFCKGSKLIKTKEKKPQQ